MAVPPRRRDGAGAIGDDLVQLGTEQEHEAGRPHPGEPEQRRSSGTDEFVAEIDNPGSTDQLLEGTYTGAGGTINAYVKLEGPTHGLLQRVLITGDFFVTPPRIVFDLEAALLGTRLDDVETTVRQFFEETDIDMLSVAADDFIAAISNALAKREGV